LLYHYEFPLEDYVTLEDSEQSYEMFKIPTDFLPRSRVNDLVEHYMKNVIDIQYLLADYQIAGIIFESVERHRHSRNAVMLLASVHAKRFRHPTQPVLESNDPDTQERLSALGMLLGRHDSLITEDAMAALHMVSSILFDGGQGGWKDWLQVANNYVDNLFAMSLSPANALLDSNAKDAFVVKTAIWFDVLASVTTHKRPHFLEAIRAMFDPNRSGIFDTAGTPPQYSMMSPMGCENHVVWALAETSELSCWKQDQICAGSLSVPDLVIKASYIDAYLAPPAIYPELPQGDRECSRHLASEIFRASARLYLRSVVSGDHPAVWDIRESVKDTLHCIGRIPVDAFSDRSTIARSVVRSTVFSFFICGALATEESQRDTIRKILEREKGESVGNCSSIHSLLDALWQERSQYTVRRGLPPVSSPPVEWRKKLKKSRILLV
jgi:hypothetical protein